MAEGLGQERFSLRHSFQRVPPGVRWILLGVAGAIAFALGFIGFGQLEDYPSFGDKLYGTIKLFFLSAPEGKQLPISLEIARFLAPLVSSYAAVMGLAALFRDRIQQMRIPLMRGHVIVCGLGFIGGAFLRQLRAVHARVVVIEPDPTNPRIETCRSSGIPVVIGDALLPRTLRAANVTKARHLLAVTNDDGTNTEVILQARQLHLEEGRGQLRCLARVGDPELCMLLRLQESSVDDGVPPLDFFNFQEVAARIMLETHPFALEGGPPHLVIGDLAKLGQWLVLHAARTWYERRPASGAPLRVSVLDDDAEARIRSLRDHHPELERVCEFAAFGTSVAEMRRLQGSLAATDVPGPTIAYLGDYRDEQALELALTLRRFLDADVPIVLALPTGDGVAQVLQSRDAKASQLANIRVFPLLDSTCTLEFLEGGSFEMLARAIHASWMAQRTASGKEATPWEDLDESRRNSSRDQARGIVTKLHSVGCEIGPLSDWDATEFRFDDAELEQLAEQEHARWSEERERDGWVLDETLTEADPVDKRTPYLIPFPDLVRKYPDIAEFDRQFVREIPARLAEAGLQVVRP
jgi:hypothetical protein